MKDASRISDALGLYANIHAKRRRIKAGSGEKMRKPGTKGAPTAKAFRKAAKTATITSVFASMRQRGQRWIDRLVRRIAAKQLQKAEDGYQCYVRNTTNEREKMESIIRQHRQQIERLQVTVSKYQQRSETPNAKAEPLRTKDDE